MADTYSPEIEERMQIKPAATMPENFEGHLNEHQLSQFDKRDHPIILTLSRIEQALEWSYQQHIILVDQMRAAEAHSIRWRKFIFSLIVWITGSIFVAVVSAVCMRIFKVL